MRLAIADIGTNSTRLLIADAYEDGRLEQLERHTEVTRLGEGVDASGRLAPAAIDRVLAALSRYREIAEATGVARRIAVATSAVREAENGDELAQRVRAEAGFDIRVIGGDEEARLTFLGATSSRPADDGETLVIDIGGGSTEFVTGHHGQDPTFHISTRLGSVRQMERHLKSDPPAHSELEALAQETRKIIAAAVPESIRVDVTSGIAVAGTPTSLAAIDQELDPYDPERVHGYRVSLAAAERILAMLALVPIPERRKIAGLHPDRAPTIVAGTAILVEAMRLFDLEEVEVSESDILDGAAISAFSGTIHGA